MEPTALTGSWISVAAACRILARKREPDGLVPLSRVRINQLVHDGRVRGRLVNARKMLVYEPDVLLYKEARDVGME